MYPTILLIILPAQIVELLMLSFCNKIYINE